MAIYWNLLCNSLSQPLVKKKKKKKGKLRARRIQRQCGYVILKSEAVRLYQHLCLCEFTMDLRK